MNKTEWEKQLADLIRAAGQELIDRAEDFVGAGDMLNGLDIWLRFPMDGTPEIELQRTYSSRRFMQVLAGPKYAVRVRCKDCAYAVRRDDGTYDCNLISSEVCFDADDYCSAGKRKGDKA